MFGEHFDHQTIRRVTSVFGTLFNKIPIKRFNDEGEVTDTIVVPIKYAPKSKWYQAVFSDTRSNRDTDEQGHPSSPIAIRPPQMGFELNSMMYAPERKLNRMAEIQKGDVSGTHMRGRTGAPYNLEYTLYIFANKTPDWSQIIEQIVPHFNPTFTVPIKIVQHPEDSDVSLTQDVMFTLTSVAPDPNMYGDFRTRETFTWALSFTCTVTFFGEYGTPSSTIQEITVDFYDYPEDGSFKVGDEERPLMSIEIPEE